MFATQTAIESLASRIQQAYALRQPGWYSGCSAPGVWTAAATTLYRIHREDPSIPLDPELYVASQSVAATLPDPWAEIAQMSAGRRYRKQVRRIIGTLRCELRSEIRLAKKKIHRGENIAKVLLSRSEVLSPLSRFIVARKAGRDDLAERLRPEAIDQHWICPLYRQASRGLVPSAFYPVADRDDDEILLDLMTDPVDSHYLWN
ncbi:hypothetical protein [Singulisphaera sp. PoT]|uniref:hypothetical protein n=1 Tax=Singulisphaera sp. PoT TaxID=3411797 RepID=UPI003BF58368